MRFAGLRAASESTQPRGVDLAQGLQFVGINVLPFAFGEAVPKA